MNICLLEMSKELNRSFWKNFQHDPVMFEKPEDFRAYLYSEESADASWNRHKSLGRVHLAACLSGNPIGEIIFKTSIKIMGAVRL